MDSYIHSGTRGILIMRMTHSISLESIWLISPSPYPLIFNMTHNAWSITYWVFRSGEFFIKFKSTHWRHHPSFFLYQNIYHNFIWPMGQVWLYRLNLPPAKKNIFPSSSYKDTWPMPRYRYGSTCNALGIYRVWWEFMVSDMFIRATEWTWSWMYLSRVR